MGTMYGKEKDIPITVLVEDLIEAKCQDPLHCTIAKAGQRALGVPLHVVWNEETGHVRVTWKSEDGRRHRGYLTPDHKAYSILMLTDTNKRKLIRRFNNGEQFDLTIVEHESRWDYSSAEQKAQYEANRLEREQLRAEGLLPPAKPRKPRAKSAVPRVGAGVRGAKTIPVQWKTP